VDVPGLLGRIVEMAEHTFVMNHAINAKMQRQTSERVWTLRDGPAEYWHRPFS
jgi:hypothetical protein